MFLILTWQKDDIQYTDGACLRLSTETSLSPSVLELLISSSELQALLPEGVLKKAISVIKDLPEE